MIVAYLNSVKSFILVNTNFRGKRKNCILMKVYIRGFHAVVSTNIYGDKLLLNL